MQNKKNHPKESKVKRLSTIFCDSNVTLPFRSFNLNSHPLGDVTTCPKCGNQAKGKFCGQCGERFTKEDSGTSSFANVQRTKTHSTSQPNANKCEQCSSENPIGAKFCKKCGQKLVSKDFKKEEELIQREKELQRQIEEEKKRQQEVNHPIVT